jgi:hypothetical protein
MQLDAERDTVRLVVKPALLLIMRRLLTPSEKEK